jgi:nucleotide-binding universal stress UspA family protein
MTFHADRVLVPVDGSEESALAAEYAIAIAKRYDADVHALYVLSERTARALDAGQVAPDTTAEEARAALGEVRDLGVEAGVEVAVSMSAGFSTTRKLVHPGSVTLDTADAVGADFIVVPRERAGGAAEVLEKVAEYVLLYASQPTLSV